MSDDAAAQSLGGGGGLACKGRRRGTRRRIEERGGQLDRESPETSLLLVVIGRRPVNIHSYTYHKHTYTHMGGNNMVARGLHAWCFQVCCNREAEKEDDDPGDATAPICRSVWQRRLYVRIYFFLRGKWPIRHPVTAFRDTIRGSNKCYSNG